MNLSNCDECGRTVLVAVVTLGHEVMFDPEQVIGGRWDRDHETGRMHRFGRLLKKGYVPHQRTCPNVSQETS